MGPNRSIFEWLKKEINDAWEHRDEITPKFTGRSKPHILEICKLLPKLNCRKCGQPTCMLFSSLAAEGIKGHADGPVMTAEGSQKLKAYLCRFRFD